MQNLAGRRILIAEDDYFVGCELAEHFRAAQAVVLGPCPTLAAADAHAAHADLAVLDVNLRGETVFPLADRLLSAGVPFVFYSAHDLSLIPARFARVGRLGKPAPPTDAVGLLAARSHGAEWTVETLLPRLRLSARLLVEDPLAADRLVEATLRLALAEQPGLAEVPVPAIWLHRLMARALHERGRALLN